MTPKEQYEARKAERAKLDAMDYQVRQETEQLMMLDTMDRFVTAVERIADALENQPSPMETRMAAMSPDELNAFTGPRASGGA